MNLAVLGAQWGDEGKGKIVDLLTPRFDIVARYQGGHNAGHTVYVAGTKFILRLIPSGILHPGVICVIGNGVVVDPQALLAEVDELKKHGIDVESRIVISDKAHLILPYHRDLDLLSEARRGERKIGTTSRGIGPAYEDKIARRGIRAGDLADPQALEHDIRDNVNARNRLVQDTTMDWRAVLDQLLTHGVRIRPWVRDVSLMLSDAMRDGKSMLFEGAQGTLLDIDHGTYPYVTSSNASIGGVCTGLGVGPRLIGGVLGVAKAYTTRVGEGPLPTELSGEMGDRLRESGNEYGAVTGRPRRCGWYDAVAVRLQRPDQRPGRAGADQAGCAGRPRAPRDLHRVPLRRPDAHRVSVGHHAPRRMRARLRNDAGLVGADAGTARVRGSAGSRAPLRRAPGGSLGSARRDHLDRIGTGPHHPPTGSDCEMPAANR